MADYYKLVRDKEADFADLHSRMDTDADLYHLKPYKMVDKENREEPDVENITLNEPAAYAHQAQAFLSSAKSQVAIEGEGLSDKDATTIETFLQALYRAIDKRLQQRFMGDLHSFLVEQICIRGIIACRFYLREVGEEFIPDVLLCDSRYILFDTDTDGLTWAAYKTQRTKEQIYNEYGLETGSATSTVTDMWDKALELVFIEETLAKSQAHNLGYVPFVIQFSPLGSGLQDAGGLRYKAESIYSDCRELYKDLNKLGTVLNTLNIMSFFGAMQYESAAGTAAQRPARPPYGKRVVIPVEKGGGYKAMPINDIKASSRLLYSLIYNAIQRGSLPAVEYGNLGFPLSALAISKLTEAKDARFQPRLKALEAFYEMAGRMLIRQYTDLKLNVELETKGISKKYSYTQLAAAGDYNIKYSLTPVSAGQNIANYSIGNAALTFLSEDTVRRDILKVESPEVEEQKRLSELANRMVPELSLYRMAKAKLEQGEELEAKIIAHKLGLTLRQLKGGKTPPATPQQAEPIPRTKEGLIPLLGRGVPAGLGRSRRAVTAPAEEETQGELGEEQ